MVHRLGGMGVDAVEISGGIGWASIRRGIKKPEQEAYFLPVARKARQVADLPIILVGGMRSRAIMDGVLAEGAADFVSLCRPLIREPDLPNRIRGGQPAATCVSCNRCWPRKNERGIACHYKGGGS
jgi:2,4-dienoyl-CoA reductase-like NADH-dependent reductase (Old Yellow Enzyme family)